MEFKKWRNGRREEIRRGRWRWRQHGMKSGTMRTVGWNCMIPTHLIHRQKSLSHELQSEWVSERANEWAQWSARAKRAVPGKQMSERCEHMSERRSEWPSTLRDDFIVILLIVQWSDELMAQSVSYFFYPKYIDPLFWSLSHKLFSFSRFPGCVCFFFSHS